MNNYRYVQIVTAVEEAELDVGMVSPTGEYTTILW